MMITPSNAIELLFLRQTYVQDQLMEEAKLVYRLLSEKKGHFYVCGDSGMAEDVGQALLLLLQNAGSMNRQESESFVALLRVYCSKIYLKVLKNRINL